MLGYRFQGPGCISKKRKCVLLQMKNGNKIAEIGKKSEINRNSGQYCWVMFSGSRVDVQKRKMMSF